MDRRPVEMENPLLEKLARDYFSPAMGREVYLVVSEDDLSLVDARLAQGGVVLVGLFAAENFNGHAGFTLFYALEKRGCPNIVLLQCPLPGNEARSVAADFPSAGWFEREIRDGFGIEFSGAFDTRRLFLHEAYPPGFHPLRKSFRNHDLGELGLVPGPGEGYAFKEVRGEGVYQVPVGPVHAGIIEPGHFRFSVIGETIFNLEIRMFYKHRGLEKLAEGRAPAQCLPVAETISGDESMANAVAFAMAVENIGGAAVPERAWALRTLMLEMERVYSHLGDLGGMLVDVAFPVGAADFQVLREEILRFNEKLTGSRFLKGVVCPGGLRRDVPQETLLALDRYLADFVGRFDWTVRFVRRLDSVVDRLETTGVIRKDLINPLNITGPAARASGVAVDTRVDHPYGLYSRLGVTMRTAENGDVISRFDVKAAETADSVALMRKVIAALRPGPVSAPFRIPDGCGLALVEAARGQNLHWVYIKNGVVDRYKVRTASFCNWQAIEHAVIGDIVPDFPLINKSLNLSYAGTDL